MEITLTPQQKAIFDAVLECAEKNHSVQIFIGGMATGKTFLWNYIEKILGDKYSTVYKDAVNKMVNSGEFKGLYK